VPNANYVPHTVNSLLRRCVFPRASRTYVKRQQQSHALIAAQPWYLDFAAESFRSARRSGSCHWTSDTARAARAQDSKRSWPGSDHHGAVRSTFFLNA